MAVWAAVLCAGPVLLTGAVPAVVLRVVGRLDGVTAAVLAVGVVVGLLLSSAAVLLSARLAGTLRALHAEALERLHRPSAPVGRRPGGRAMMGIGGEVDELASALHALHLRVRVGDELVTRQAREAETSGAGIAALLSGLVAAEEGTRGQLAAELHDTVAQSLMIAGGLLAGPRSVEQDRRVTDYVQDAEEQLRAVMARTSPPALRDGDLATAVLLLGDDLRHRYGLVVTMDWPARAYALPLSSAVTLYRFFQEALLNVVKHADVDAATARLLVTDTTLQAVVSDAGSGFTPKAVRPVGGRHVGLDLLRERARLSGGLVQVDSQVGGGTTLTLRLPRSASGSALIPRQAGYVEQPAPQPVPTPPGLSAQGGHAAGRETSGRAQHV